MSAGIGSYEESIQRFKNAAKLVRVKSQSYGTISQMIGKAVSRIDPDYMIKANRAIAPLELDIPKIVQLAAEAGELAKIWSAFGAEIKTNSDSLKKLWQGEAADAAQEKIKRSSEDAIRHSEAYEIAQKNIVAGKIASEKLLHRASLKAEEISKRETVITLDDVFNTSSNIQVAYANGETSIGYEVIFDASADPEKSIWNLLVASDEVKAMKAEFEQLLADTEQTVNKIWAEVSGNLQQKELPSATLPSDGKCSTKCKTPKTDGHAKTSKNDGADQSKGKDTSKDSGSKDNSENAGHSGNQESFQYTGGSSGGQASTIPAPPTDTKNVGIGPETDTAKIKEKTEITDTYRSNKEAQDSTDRLAKIIQEENQKYRDLVDQILQDKSQTAPIGGLQTPPYGGGAGFNYQTYNPLPAESGLAGGFQSDGSNAQTPGIRTEIEGQFEYNREDSSAGEPSQSGDRSSSTNRPSWGLKVGGELNIDGEGVRISGDLEVGELNDSTELDTEANEDSDELKHSDSKEELENDGTEDTEQVDEDNSDAEDTDSEDENEEKISAIPRLKLSQKTKSQQTLQLPLWKPKLLIKVLIAHQVERTHR